MILKRLFAYITVLFLATACFKYDKPKKPKNLIPKEKMVHIIMDVRLLSSANGTNKTILDNNNLQAEIYVYNKYGIDSLQFALSNDYYAYYIDDYKAIYDKVKDSFEVLKTKYADLALKEEAEKKYRDSIRGIIKKDSTQILKLKEHLNILVKKDSLSPLIKKDSLRLITLKDSLNILIKKDSLTRFKLKSKSDVLLITPVSDTDFQ
ncbi:DUF4296 domain-containing protein [Hwangdonia lutea]|uniref:DUF4296 domain-containing protein n=1 Tax=Hwangdonia lutea TaxID=3075823 RepID=A0AA97ESK3_9FLAO|nr:DUF4296 domain-containing protein [Hwangdonia sp. SCSIO 19198]WOD45158.1 DUF4296 domain-containing protein [Hwangdonia sp. SCSIO 19198]